MTTRFNLNLSRPLTAMLAALTLGAVSLPALADGAVPTNRQQVREELRMWKATNMMSQSGEISEPPAVLEARDAFYALQRDVLEEENLAAWQQWQLAQQEMAPVALLVLEAE